MQIEIVVHVFMLLRPRKRATSTKREQLSRKVDFFFCQPELKKLDIFVELEFEKN